jgi:acyl-CoA reductase-like NAD-dependent aldehyde dehydrogenase
MVEYLDIIEAQVNPSLEEPKTTAYNVELPPLNEQAWVKEFSVKYFSYSLLFGNAVKSEKITVFHNPFTSEIVGKAQLIDDDDLQIFCSEQFENNHLKKSERVSILHNTAEILNNNAETMAKLIAIEVGKPIRQARTEVKKSVEYLRLLVHDLQNLTGEIVLHSDEKTIQSSYSPRGLCLIINSFSFPLLTLVQALGPAIGAGNRVCIKPTQTGPLVAYNLLEMFFEAGLTRSMASFMNLQQEQTLKLISSSTASIIAFSGSLEAAHYLKSLIPAKTKSFFDLDSLSAVAVFEDSDFQNAVASTIKGAFSFSGQALQAVKVAFVHKSIAQEFMENLVLAANNLVIGNPLDEETDIGPLIDEAACESFHSLVQQIVKNGHHLLSGGFKLGRNCYSPTIFYSKTIPLELPLDSLKGPILFVQTFADKEEIPQLLNEFSVISSLGIFTQSMNSINYLIENLHLNDISINEQPLYKSQEKVLPLHPLSDLPLKGTIESLKAMSQVKFITNNQN